VEQLAVDQFYGANFECSFAQCSKTVARVLRRDTSYVLLLLEYEQNTHEICSRNIGMANDTISHRSGNSGNCRCVLCETNHEEHVRRNVCQT
jgi:hypothetical protein